MKIICNNKRSFDDSLSAVRCPLSAARGISLMEVLASTFVVGVGLLGVLAVIPFGAYQVNKANNADYTSNVLRDAAAELRIYGFAQPASWGIRSTACTYFNMSDQSTSVSNLEICRPIASTTAMNCTRFIVVDPFDTSTFAPIPYYSSGGPNPGSAAVPQGLHLYKIGSNLTYRAAWAEAMRGQDDIQYTTAEDKRTVLTTTGSMKSVSSGQYSWFFTIKPPTPSTAAGMDHVNVRNLPSSVSVDILACYNRTPGDTTKERSVQVINPATPLPAANPVAFPYQQQLTGAQLTLQASSAESLDVSRTKWILVTWPTGNNPPDLPIDGCWCKIVSSSQTSPYGSNYARTVTVIGALPSTYQANMQAFIVDGVLDHQRIDDVPFY